MVSTAAVIVGLGEKEFTMPFYHKTIYHARLGCFWLWVLDPKILQLNIWAERCAIWCASLTGFWESQRNVVIFFFSKECYILAFWSRTPCVRLSLFKLYHHQTADFKATESAEMSPVYHKESNRNCSTLTFQMAWRRRSQVCSIT